MKKKLTRDEIKEAICDMVWKTSGSYCKQCPYFTKKKWECTLEKDLEEVFASAPAPIPTADKWVETTYNLYHKDEEACGATSGRSVVIVDIRQKKMEIARCRKEDEFDSTIGVAIAYARLRGLPVHPEYASKKDKVLGER